MPTSEPYFKSRINDLIAGLVVFLVALPLCLGVAVASKSSSPGITDATNVALISGLVAGIVGGIVVGLISGSQTSVSGPAAGLTAVVAAQVALVGSFQGFLVAVVLAGAIQILMGLLRAGLIADFIPTCVIKGLLFAIGLILILKQIPHLLGHDSDPLNDMSFIQPDGENTFSELIATAFDINVGAASVGLISLVFLFAWDSIKVLKKSLIPSALIVVVMGCLLASAFTSLGGTWVIGNDHLVNVPVTENIVTFFNVLIRPDWSVLDKKAVYIAAITIAIVASLETLLNLEAVDKIDPQQRTSPPNRELFAQGAGNMVSGLLGGLPVTSVIVRSSVNINSGAKSKVSAIFHGVLLLVCVVYLANWLNLIPNASLAAILIVTGYKLANPKLVVGMWKMGWSQFLPFAVTVLAIVFTDLLIGILIGLAVSIGFILSSNVRRPLWRVVEKHVGGEVLHIHLANQVSFLNRATMARTLSEIPRGSHVLIDARDTDYIDPDILDLIKTYESETAPAHGVRVSMLGFRDHYSMDDRILYADYTSRELRDQLTPDGVLQILKDGNSRFTAGIRLSRDLNRQINATASGQFPLAAVLSCIDSRAPVELVFDLGLGDIFTIRIAGNVAKEKVYGSLEYATVVAGIKLIVVMGHTRCGAVTAAVDLASQGKDTVEGAEHVGVLVKEIQRSIILTECKDLVGRSKDEKEAYVDRVALENVRKTIHNILISSEAIRSRVASGQIKVVGCMYNVSTGIVTFDEQSGRV